MGVPQKYITCPGCGKRGYESKKAAKREMRSMSMQNRGLSVYECSDAGEFRLWHWGHLPYQVKEGRWDRGSIGAAAPRKPWRPRVT